jgi:hypothetical protein
MIVRNWHGRVPVALADRYLALMREVALPDYRSTPGNLGAWCLIRRDGEVTHFEMLTFWTDLEAVKRFAGQDFERAKYYDFDAEFLIEKEPHVRHYEAVSE